MAIVNINGTLASSVAASSGTLVISYPTGTTAGSFNQSVAHSVVINGNVIPLGTGFTVSFGSNSSGITITNKSASAWPQGASYYASFETIGEVNFTASNGFQPNQTAEVNLLEINLGSPAASSSTAIAASQAVTAASATGATLASSVLDVPRNVVAAWTNSAVLTVRGTDVYGNALTESMASGGTSFTGKKAFKTISSIKVSADVTGLTAGTGKVLGLPVFLPSAANIVREIEDGATATAGTTVAGLALASGPSTATTADVLGTYAPNSNPDATKAFTLIVALADPGYKGLPQFSA